ncbi:MAG: aspartate aminotransferase family protein [Anaerolineales bacterium]|nr:aspartate aminotransferase family protein [Anaerolineales bacterium]
MPEPDGDPPGPTVGGTQVLISLEDRHTSGAYPKRPLAIVRGEGIWLWDAEGRRYMDMTSGQGVALLGHSHPAILETVRRQAELLITCPEIFYNDRRSELYASLSQYTPEDLNRFFLCNSGTEAVEGALKFARLKTGRPGIVAAKSGFHGRTFGALSATWNPSHRRGFGPLLPEVSHIPFNDLRAVDAAIDTSTAAVILEVVQGEGGVVPATGEFLELVRRLCEQRGALLIFDEVQTGLGRTGRRFAAEHFSVTPDVICVGKGLAGGLPIGAVIWRDSLGKWPQGSHGSTLGGNPLACAAATATLSLLDSGLLEHVAQVGEKFLADLRELEHPMIREVRGLGLMIGIDLRRRVTPVLKALMERGVLALPAGPTVLRLLPPLVVTEEQLIEVFDAMLEALEVLEDE